MVLGMDLITLLVLGNNESFLLKQTFWIGSWNSSDFSRTEVHYHLLYIVLLSMSNFQLTLDCVLVWENIGLDVFVVLTIVAT